MPFPCVLLQATSRWRRSLRRFRWSADCDGACRCDEHAVVWFVEGAAPIAESLCAAEARERYIGWPTACRRCGRAFDDGDPWQVSAERLWRTDVGLELTREEMPAGAMFQADWLEDWPTHNHHARAGGPLMVRLPDGMEWNIDGPASSGGYWTVSGEPPAITASPSIATPGYHGFLRDGVLTDDLDGRTYPGALDAPRARG